MVSKASEDLPEPESPVNTTRASRGISRSTFFRLCSRAPRTWIVLVGSDGGPDLEPDLEPGALPPVSPVAPAGEVQDVGQLLVAGELDQLARILGARLPEQVLHRRYQGGVHRIRIVGVSPVHVIPDRREPLALLAGQLDRPEPGIHSVV